MISVISNRYIYILKRKFLCNMERKLIRQGGGGYTIYLPKKWIDAKGLNEKSTVDVTEEGSDLVVRTRNTKKTKCTIKITESNASKLKDVVTHAYRLGPEIIEIKNVNPEIIKELSYITSHYLLGFDLTRTTNNSCTLENISEPAENKYDVVFNRIFMMVKECNRILIESYEKGDFCSLQEVENLSVSHDKYLNFCFRILFTGKPNKSNVALNVEFLHNLSYILRRYVFLYKYCSNNKVKKNKNIAELLKILDQTLEHLYDLTYKKDINAAFLITSVKREYTFSKTIKMLEESKGKETVVISLVRDLLRNIEIAKNSPLSEIIDAEMTESTL